MREMIQKRVTTQSATGTLLDKLYKMGKRRKPNFVVWELTQKVKGVIPKKVRPTLAGMDARIGIPING